MENLSQIIDNIAASSVRNHDGSYDMPDNPFEELISMGELVDRLTIINIKLFLLKDEVMKRPEDNKFKSWAAEEDVKLVMERSRLKKCIDAKLISIISKIVKGDESGGFNPEVKKYG